MAEVTAGERESFESVLKRFNKKIQQEDVFSEIRRHEFFEKTSLKRKRKEATRRRKSVRTSER